MRVSAVLKNARLSAQKCRLVADQVRGLPVDAALNILTFSPKKGAVLLKKVLESAIATSFWTAVKTGTSKEMRDNWCVGYSPSYTVGVWVGNFSGEPMWEKNGTKGDSPAL